MSAISGTAPTAPAADTCPSLAVVLLPCVLPLEHLLLCYADPGFRVLDPPLGLCGPVVAGYGRGSKELGVPTANLDPEALGSALDGLSTGIYCGWASIEGSEPYMAVMSIGLCVAAPAPVPASCIGNSMLVPSVSPCVPQQSFLQEGEDVHRELSRYPPCCSPCVWLNRCPHAGAPHLPHLLRTILREEHEAACCRLFAARAQLRLPWSVLFASSISSSLHSPALSTPQMPS